MVLNQSLTNLSASEFEELVTIPEVVNVIQRVEMVLRIKKEIKRYINELGNEGRLISMQMDELVSNMEEEAWLYADYAREYSEEKIREIILALKRSTDEERWTFIIL